MIPQLKKLLLVAAVVILFALYAVQERPQSIAVDSRSLAVLQSPQPSVRSSSPTPAPSQTPTNLPSATSPVETEPAQAIARANEQATATLAPPTATATEIPAPPTATAIPSGRYVDGVYTGIEADARWGYVNVSVTVTNGELTDVAFLEYPNHRNRSQEINNYAIPELIQEAIQSQSAEVDIVSGATDTSFAFIQSLDAALQQALR